MKTFGRALMLLVFPLGAMSQHAPFRTADTYSNLALRAIAYGISAPNAHNSQMWRIDTLSATELLLYVVHTIPETDPPARQVLISAGCFIECMAIGLSNEGYDVQVQYLPEGDFLPVANNMSKKPVAHITLVKNSSVTKDVLFDDLYARQSNRKPYHGRMITADEFDSLRSLIGPTHSSILFLNDKHEMKPYQAIFSRAMKIETITRDTHDETRSWFRFSEKEVEEKRDGMSLRTTGLQGLLLVFAEKSLAGGDSLTWHSPRVQRATVKSIDKSIYSAKGLVFFETSSNTKIDWLLTGRDFVRYNIAVAKMHLATSHFNQVLQEYPEMAGLQSDFNTRIGVGENEKVQLILRIGRAEASYRSQRRDIESFLLESKEHRQ